MDIATYYSFPDLSPWIDNISDIYEELPYNDYTISYDE